MKIVRTAFIAGLAAAWVVGALVAQETRITVRVVANDAKIIGTGVGGARVIIRNAATGEVLGVGVAWDVERVNFGRSQARPLE